MNNFDMIKNFSMDEMIDFINLLIDEGHHLLADELDNTGVEYENCNYEEVKEWLSLDTLKKMKNDR